MVRVDGRRAGSTPAPPTQSIKGGCMTGKRELTDSQQKDVDEMAGNFGRTLGSNDPEESDEDFFRGW
ncbi:MAG TPA: hypothetical protein VIY48_10770 [Candidatus Paceibacterota bacterium]